MTTALMVVVGIAIVAGVVWVIVRMERSHRQRIERRREAWRAGGCVGPEPSKYPGGPEREDWEGECVGGISGGGISGGRYYG